MATMQVSEDLVVGGQVSGGLCRARWPPTLGGVEIWAPHSAHSPPLGGPLAAPLPSLGLRLLICKQEIRTSSQGCVEMRRRV